MPEIIGLDPQIIDSIAIDKSILTDPILIETVNDALNRLDPESMQLIYDIFYQGLSLSSIACRDGIPLKEMTSRYYEIKRQLKISLAGFVRDRWGLKVNGICKICSHPQKGVIDKIIIAKDDSESWGQVCKNLESLTGEKFRPPQILKAHIKHISNRQNGGNNNAE